MAVHIMAAAHLDNITPGVCIGIERKLSRIMSAKLHLNSSLKEMEPGKMQFKSK